MLVFIIWLCHYFATVAIAAALQCHMQGDLHDYFFLRNALSHSQVELYMWCETISAHPPMTNWSTSVLRLIYASQQKIVNLPLLFDVNLYCHSSHVQPSHHLVYMVTCLHFNWLSTHPSFIVSVSCQSDSRSARQKQGNYPTVSVCLYVHAHFFGARVFLCVLEWQKVTVSNDPDLKVD